ncbi:hypothetical protein KJ564_08960 [bacterium]|nr:hypothetical protein [bacterium]
MNELSQKVPGIRSLKILSLLILAILYGALASNVYAARISGTFQTQTRGYQDHDGEDHLEVAPGLRINAYGLGIQGLSLHAYGMYYGDSVDDFSQSAQDRLYHAYFKYATAKSAFTVRAGRFFQFRGVAVGVLDGGEVSYQLNPRWTVTAFGGQQGPLERNWDVDRQGDSPWFGGELRWNPTSFFGRKSVLSLSYSRQERDENLLRHIAGLNFYVKVSPRWTSLNILHLNLEGSALRKAMTRWRYTCPKFQFSLEGALIQPYSATYSWFSDFESNNIVRLKNTVEYHYRTNHWGAGLSSMVFGKDEIGFRTGPYVIFPYGRVGYSQSFGDHSNKNTLWGYLKYSPLPCLDLKAYAANMEYEWEALYVGTYETTALSAGFTLRPSFLKRTAWDVEYQHYQTPEVESDRRVIAAFKWNFDYSGK